MRVAADAAILKRRRPPADDTGAAASEPYQPMEKRKEPRFRAQFDALYSTGPAEGAGLLVDLSYSGARLEGASLRPEVGTTVRLYVFVQPVAPFYIEGRVTRITESGFAIVYELDDPEVRRLVDDVSAIVSTS